jgi:uncharacterized protein (TIGR02145 family)
MTLARTLVIVSLLALAGNAQSVNIKGFVKNKAGVAIPGAIVTLVKGGQRDTSDANGYFALSGPSLAVRRPYAAGSDGEATAFLRSGYLHVNLSGRSPLEIVAFDVQGKAVYTLKNPAAQADSRLLLPRNGAGVRLYRIRTDRGEMWLKGYSIQERETGVEATTHGSSDRAMAKTASALSDDIAATKDGYLDYRMRITDSVSDSLKIVMILSAGTVTDIDGNVYHTVRIGSQVWTVENLRTTKLNDGTAILNETDNSRWFFLAGPGYCYYNNTANADSIRRFGALYNWPAVGTAKLAPTGWHVPTSSEWDTLQSYLIANGYNWDGTTTDNKTAKSLASMTDWVPSASSVGAVGNDLTLNNSSGFCGLPGGFRNYSTLASFFVNRGFIGYWWTATDVPESSFAFYSSLNNDTDFLDKIEYFQTAGFSVRLVKD